MAPYTEGGPYDGIANRVLQNCGKQRAHVCERANLAGFPKIAEDDDAGYRCVGAPEGGERVTLVFHNEEKYREICGAESYHRPDL